MYFWLNRIPETFVGKCNDHSYEVLKYVVAKQIKCKNYIISEKKFLSSHKSNHFYICCGKAKKMFFFKYMAK